MRHESAPLWSPCNLEQPGVGVAGVSPGEKFIKVILTQDELHPLDVVRVLRPPGADEIHLVIVQRLDGLQHFPGQKYKSGDVGGGRGGGGTDLNCGYSFVRISSRSKASARVGTLPFGFGGGGGGALWKVSSSSSRKAGGEGRRNMEADGG